LLGELERAETSQEEREMAELNQQQVIDYIKGISVLELSQLVKALESELGVSAASAMPMAMPGMGAGAAAAAPAEEKTEFNVALVSFPADKNKEEAETIRKKFDEVGAKVEIK
jgi:large subunit ribosomal protein L7/L12